MGLGDSRSERGFDFKSESSYDDTGREWLHVEYALKLSNDTKDTFIHIQTAFGRIPERSHLLRDMLRF